MANLYYDARSFRGGCVRGDAVRGWPRTTPDGRQTRTRRAMLRRKLRRSSRGVWRTAGGRRCSERVSTRTWVSASELPMSPARAVRGIRDVAQSTPRDCWPITLTIQTDLANLNLHGDAGMAEYGNAMSEIISSDWRGHRRLLAIPRLPVPRGKTSATRGVQPFAS